MKKEEQNVVNSFYKEVDSINLSGNNLKMQRLKISNTLSNFSKEISSITIDKSLKENNKELYELFENSLMDALNKINSWIKSIEEQNNKEKFRDELKDKFIVIIFGKVK